MKGKSESNIFENDVGKVEEKKLKLTRILSGGGDGDGYNAIGIVKGIH